MFQITINNNLTISTGATIIFENGNITIGDVVFPMAMVTEMEITSDFGFGVEISEGFHKGKYVAVSEVHYLYDGVNSAIESDFFSTGISLVDFKIGKITIFSIEKWYFKNLLRDGQMKVE